jgi:SAM-dependent methyltransferase
VSEYRGIELSYGCEPSRLPAELASRFVELELDDGTRRWIDRALERPQARATSAIRDVAAKMVGLYDANALLGAFPMRVLGTDQWRPILGEAAGGRLLDVGAGDGAVTAEAAALFDEVVATELSHPMARRLRRRGLRCHEVDLATEPLLEAEGTFDVISLLNVLDRTSRPLSLLERLPALCRPGGRLVVAVPVPIRPVVYVGPQQVDPEEVLPGGGEAGFEAGVSALWQWGLAPLGYRVEVLTRVPYLCRGDARRPVEVLDDAVFVCSFAT